MQRILILWFVCGFIVMGANTASATERTNVLPEQIEGRPKAMMLHRFLLRKADLAFARRAKRYEQIDSVEDVTAYQQRQRQFMRDRIGGLPAPTPLKPRATRAFQHGGLRLEKILFQSRPGFYVTATLYLPDQADFTPPYPGVVVACGHARQSKAYPMYQKAASSLARHGMAALMFDPVGQGERKQAPPPIGGEVPTVHGKRIGLTSQHSLPGVGSILMGRNIARTMIHDGMRAVDYLASREEVDDDRIGFMGNSGGGTQTAYVYALDDRLKAASPACYITDFQHLLRQQGPQDAEQIIFNQIGFGLNHGDYLMMQAPTPMLICAATRDAFDIRGTWASYREAKRLFMRLDHPFHMDMAEHDGAHGYQQPLREAAVQWMQRWLRGVDQPVEEKPYDTLSPEKLHVTAKGDVLSLEGARSIFEINQAYQQKLAEERERLWRDGINSDLRQRIRDLAGIPPVDDLTEPTVDRRGQTNLDVGQAAKLVFELSNGVLLPALYLAPESESTKRPVLIVHEKGKQKVFANGRVASLLKRGHNVLALDPRGVGETAPADGEWYDPAFGPAARQAMTAYLLGDSLMGMRAEDLLIAARWLARHPKSADEATAPKPIELRATGHLCVPALHASALNPDRFSRVYLQGGLRSWASVVNIPRWRGAATNVVHGALGVYDLPRLRAALGEKLTVEGLHDAAGRSVGK